MSTHQNFRFSIEKVSFQISQQSKGVSGGIGGLAEPKSPLSWKIVSRDKSEATQQREGGDLSFAGPHGALLVGRSASSWEKLLRAKTGPDVLTIL